MPRPSYECEDSFLINYTGMIDCDFTLSQTDPITAVDGSNPFTRSFIFKRKSATVGTYIAYITYSLNGAAFTESAPDGVSVGMTAFSDTPDFAVGAEVAQSANYSGNVVIDADTVGENRVSINIEIGLVR